MHVPVLLNEVLEHLNLKHGRKFVDGTVGGGGHLLAIAKQQPQARSLGIDLDQTSLDELREKLVQMGLDQRIMLVQGNYKDIDKIISDTNFGTVDGIILDLGFSSQQLDREDRGFSFQKLGPLDMRYDLANSKTAAEVVNHFSEKELIRIIEEYSEEKFSRRIAQAIIKARKEKAISTTLELADVIKSAIPQPLRFKASDSIRRVFQAIRIEVNNELKNLREFLPKSLDLLNTKGRLVIISFHSLEDRIVKEFFNEQAKDCVCPPQFPTCVCDKVSPLRILTRKPLTASEEEQQVNSRSKSAKLRAAEKI